MKKFTAILTFLILGNTILSQQTNIYDGDYQYEPRKTLIGASFTGTHYETFSYGDDNPRTSYNVNIKWPISTSTVLIEDSLIPAGKLSRSVIQVTKRKYNRDFEGGFIGYGVQASWDKFDSTPFGDTNLFRPIVSEHIKAQGIGGEVLVEFGWRLSLGNTFTMAPCIGIGYGFSMVKDSRESITFLNYDGTEDVVSNPDYDQDPGLGGINMHIGLGFGLRQRD